MVFYSGGSRPSDNGVGRGGGQPHPKITGRGRSQKSCFWPFEPQFRQEIRGKGGGGAGPLPWIRHCLMYS